MKVKKSSPKTKISKTQRKKQLAAQRIEKIREERFTTLNDILSFRKFLSCSFEPRISDVEIIVCFADLRGFSAYCQTLQSEMQDRKIQNFLRSYVKVFNEGLMSWYVDWIEDPSTADQHDKIVLARHVVPTSYKNLGDGVMMIWEIPSDLSMDEQGIIAFQIIFMLDEIRGRFLYRFRNLSLGERDSYSDEVLKLDLGFGVARGHAWKLDFGDHVDYAGSVVNLAARLESLARPAGMVAQADVSPSYFLRMSNDKNGHLVSISGIKGFGSDVRAWIGSEVEHDASQFRIIKSLQRR